MRAVTRLFLPSLACSFTLVAAQSVTSASVPIREPWNVFDSIADASGGNNASRLVDTTNVFVAAYAADFVVDGDVTKSVWSKARPVGAFLTRAGQTARYATELKLLYSAKALYVGASFFQPMDKIITQYDQNDQPVYNDDCLEAFFLVPAGKGEDMLQLAINALGSCWDGKNGRSSWNVKGLEIKTKKFADRWTMEAKLPFPGLGIDRPVPGDFVGARFCRRVQEPKFEGASVPQLKESGNNQRKMFAKLVFGEPDGKAADEARRYRARIMKERVEARLAAARRSVSAQEAAAAHFPDLVHPTYNAAAQAVHQMKAGLKKFEKGRMSTNDFIALDAGFRKYAGEHAYAAWTASLWEKGAPDRMPPEKASMLPNLSFEQAGNEREQICLEFTGLLCGSRIDLRLVPLTVDEPRRKRFVSCNAFEIYEEPFINYEKDLITAPLVRKPGNMVTLSPGRVTRVWVVFNSRGVQPGEYKTKILLKPAYDMDVMEQSIDVAMKVWNFTLPETRDWPLQTFFWGPNFYDNDETQVLRLMHDHHVTHGWTKSQLYTFGIHRDRRRVHVAGEDDPVFFDRHLAETANEDFFRAAKDLGMRFVFGWGCPHKTPEWFHLMDRRLRGMGFVPGDYVFKTLIKDEFVKSHIPQFADQRAAVTRELGTNLWFQAVYLSTPPPTGATMEDIESAKLPEFFKMWTVIDGVFRDPKRGADVTRRLRSKGCKVWSYQCNRYMQTLGVLDYYRFYAWKCYMRGLDGAAIWCSGTPSGDDGWDSRDEYDDGILWSGNGKEMIPTKRFEAFREGLEDVAYMDWLKKELARHKAAGRSFPQYETLLSERAAIVRANDQTGVDEWRLAIGRAIDSLVDKKAE